MKYIKTVDMYEQIINCEEIDELKEILDKYSPYYTRWKDYISTIILKNHLSYKKMGKMCGLSRNTIKAWIKDNKVPQNREMFLKLGLGFRFNLTDMNYMLQRYGKYPKLYPKSLEDAVCIYVIAHYPEDEEVSAYEIYKSMKDEFLKIIKIRNKRMFLVENENRTYEMEKEIHHAKNPDDFLAFVKKNEVEFQNSYYKLLDYLSAFIKAENMGKSYHNMVVGREMDKGFEKLMSNLRNWGEVPNRRKLLQLGVHLNMSLKEMNQMLVYANMEKLCPKDKLECIILYVLANVDVNTPYNEINHAVLVSQYTENEEIKKQCNDLLTELIGLKNSEEIREDVEYYIRDTLLTIDEEYGEEFLW